MEITENDIVYQNDVYWVLRRQHPKSNKIYYQVLQDTITHSKVCATIGDGEGPNLGLERAIIECDKRANCR